MRKRGMLFELDGHIEAVEPISITLMNSGTGAPRKPVAVGGEIMQQVILPATTIRGALRRSCLQIVSEVLAVDDTLPFDLPSYQWNAVGGVRAKGEGDSKGTDMMRALELSAQNPIIGIMGAGAIFVEGKLAVGIAKQRMAAKADKFVHSTTTVRKDDMLSDPELVASISDEDRERFFQYSGVKKEVTRLKNEKLKVAKEANALRRRHNTLSEDEKKKLRDLEERRREVEREITAAQTSNPNYKGTVNVPHTVEYIIEGTEFEHWMRLHDATPIEIGLLIDALRRFSRHASIGGLGARGFGEIRAEYRIRVHDGKTFDEEDQQVYSEQGRLIVERGAFRIEDKGPDVVAAIEAWKSAKEGLLADMNFDAPTREA